MGAAPAAQPRRHKTKIGRFRPDIADAILNAIRAGQTDTVACAAAGLHRQRLYEWLQLGREQSSGRYHDFLLAYEKARADSEVPIVTVVRRTIVGGVFRLPVYDETGEREIDERTGKPKVRSVTMLPDGRLGMRLLAVRNPRDWSGKEQPPEKVERPSGRDGSVINLFAEAVRILLGYGIKPPFELPPDVFKSLPADPALTAANKELNGATLGGTQMRNGKPHDPEDENTPF
jgi:hypothetical protein